MDKISQLPEPILHYILNFLESKEAARTAILSKNWRTIFNSRPVLNFVQSRAESIFFGPNLTEGEEKIFVTRIDDSIQKFLQHKLSIHKFALQVKPYNLDRWDSHMNRWMHQLVNEANVEELFINILKPTLKPDYMLPPIVFCSKTITSLILVHCDLRNCSTLKLPNLLELSLRRALLSQEVIKKLISGCPSLEILQLSHCHWLSEICVSDLARLRKVNLAPCVSLNKVKIVAPELQVFEYCGGRGRPPMLCEINLFACESTLKKLILSNANLKKDTLMHHVSNLCALEELVLCEPYINSIEFTHCKLQRLIIEDCKKIEMVRIYTPNLQYLKYRNNNIPFYPMNFSLLPKVELHFQTIGKLCYEFERCCESLKEFFIRFNQFKDIKLILRFYQNAIVFEELGENVITMLQDLKNERPDIEVKCMTTYESMVDCLFKNRPRLNIVSLAYTDHTRVNEFLQALNKKILKGNEEPKCCKYEQFKCWRHFLFDFEIEKTKPDIGCKITKIKLKWIEK